MKTKHGFVSNSSSTAFTIRNTSKKPKTLLDFAKETPELLKKFLERYNWYKENSNFTQAKLEESAKQMCIVFPPGKNVEAVFGDEQGTVVGHVYDYILREGGKSKSFKWKFKEYHR